MTYLCPKCRGIMCTISTASIPPIISYVCFSCGYKSKPEETLVHEEYATLPPWLWQDEDQKEIKG